MPYRAVTPDTRKALIVLVTAFNSHHQLGMAFATRGFGDAPIVSFDPDRIRVPAGRKGERMPETIIRFGGVLADKICRSVAIIAGGD